MGILLSQICESSPGGTAFTFGGVAGRGRAWQEMGGFTVWCFLHVFEAEATQRHGNVARGGPSCKCYSFATCQNDQVQPCQYSLVSATLSDLVRSCQILSHVHWAGLFEQSKSSICGIFQMPVLSRFVVSYQSKGGPVTFEFLGVTSDMD